MCLRSKIWINREELKYMKYQYGRIIDVGKKLKLGYKKVDICMDRK